MMSLDSFENNLETCLKNVCTSKKFEKILHPNGSYLKVEYLTEPQRHHLPNEHLIDDDFDFITQNEKAPASAIGKYYGLEEFIVISDWDKENVVLCDYSTMQCLLSSLFLTLTSTKTVSIHVPVFVKMHHYECYQGVYFDRNQWMISFEQVLLRKIPLIFYNLQQVLSLFKSKIDISTLIFERCKISCQFSYRVDELVDEQDLVTYFECDDYEVPFGISESPVHSIVMRSKWLNFYDNYFFETESHSNFDISNASECSLQINWRDDLSSGQTSRFLSKIYHNLNTSFGVLFENDQSKNSLHYDRINAILDELFADDLKELPTQQNNILGYMNKLKSCEKNSLVWKLAIVLMKQENVHELTCVWNHFVGEIESRCRLGIPISTRSGMSSPSIKTCLLNQKLQQLNYCIGKKNDWEIGGKDYASDNAISSDEEFYDCETESSSFTAGATGRLKKLSNLKLLQTNEPIYVPVTQENLPKTEDETDQDVDYLVHESNSESRLEMMGTLLFSDMQSFKAANPGAVFEDFIRWYSPNDWIETDNDENSCGKLSERMKIENNTWQSFWRDSKPVAALQQKPLFDYSAQIDKVIGFFQSRKFSEIIDLITPAILHAVFDKLYEEISELELVSMRDQQLKNLLQSISSFLQTPTTNRNQLGAILEEFRKLEQLILRMQFLLINSNKFYDLDKNELCNGYEVIVPDSSYRNENSSPNMDLKRLLNFRDEPKKPFEKEFVFKLYANCPHSYSRKRLQFMRAVFNENQYCLTGAFAEDIL